MQMNDTKNKYIKPDNPLIRLNQIHGNINDGKIDSFQTGSVDTSNIRD